MTLSQQIRALLPKALKDEPWANISSWHKLAGLMIEHAAEIADALEAWEQRKDDGR